MNINGSVNRFANNLGNGVIALEETVNAIDHVRTHRDTTIIARMIDRATARKDPQAARAVAFLARKVFEGAKVVSKKDKPTSVQIKDATVSNSAVEILHTLKDEGVSLRGPKVRSAFAVEKEDKAFDVKAWAERMKKSHADDLDAMIAALQAVR
ncbi:MAG: hypothetical protein KJO69_10750 [Gammaproteobacteria bacterium]|nr:hypothetical protein [Gammaproteobacteria bacterium]